MILDSMEWSDRPSSNCHLGHSIEKAGPEPLARRHGGKGSAVLGPRFLTSSRS
jgi:hypothetical protein